MKLAAPRLPAEMPVRVTALPSAKVTLAPAASWLMPV
jgi:hypothetical protein